MLINRIARAACLGLVAAAALSACGSDGPDSYTGPEAEPDVAAVEATAGEDTDAAPTSGDAGEGAAEVAAEGAGEGAAEGQAGETVEVKALDNTFIEDEVDVAAGTEVVWKNGGRNDHDIVPVVEDESWGVGIEAFHPGDSYSYTFTEPGEYAYYCTIHGTADVGMTGTIIVS